jgi:hypothetical protein
MEKAKKYLKCALRLSPLFILSISQLSHAAAEMYRENAPQVQGAQGGVIAIGKSLAPLGTACKGHFSAPHYILSERGIGVKPLILGGTPYEILESLATCPDGVIENQSKILPYIYMGIVRYRFGKGWKGLFPMQDFMQLFVEQATKIGGQFIPTVDGVGHSINDASGNFGDFVDWLKARKPQGKNKKLKTPKDTDKVYVKFSYLQEEGMEKIGTGSVTFKKILNRLYFHLKPMSSPEKNKKLRTGK